VDVGNLMDAVANTADTLELKLPGFSNFQRAVFQAEVEYAEQGLRKEADAIQALGEVIEGKEGSEERLNAAVGDAGPLEALAEKLESLASRLENRTA